MTTSGAQKTAPLLEMQKQTMCLMRISLKWKAYSEKEERKNASYGFSHFLRMDFLKMTKQVVLGWPPKHFKNGTTGEDKTKSLWKPTCWTVARTRTSLKG